MLYIHNIYCWNWFHISDSKWVPFHHSMACPQLTVKEMASRCRG